MGLKIKDFSEDSFQQYVFVMKIGVLPKLLFSHRLPRVLLFWSLLSTHSLLAWQQEPLTLLNRLEQAENIERVDVLNRLSEHYRNHDLQKSVAYAREAIELASQLKDADRLAASYLNAGVALRSVGKSDEALQLFNQARLLAEQSGLKAVRADALHKIGVTHLLVKEFDDALYFFQQELPLWEELKDDQGLSGALNSLGLLYINMKRLPEAREALTKALQLAEKIGDRETLYKPLVNLGDLYLQSGETEKAIVYIRRALDMSEESKNRYGIAIGHLKLATAFRQQQKHELALNELQLALQTANSINVLSIIRNTYSQFAEVYEDLNDFRAALKFNKLYVATEDSMISEVTKRKIAEIQARYEIEKQEKELELLQKKMEYERLRLVSGLTVLALGFVMATILMSRHRLKKQASEHMAAQQDAIRIQQQHLNWQQEQMAFRKLKIDEATGHARSLQTALQSESLSFLKLFAGYFLTQLPKEEVGGDFCWFAYKQDSVFIIAGDCSGYGTTGAFNSFVVNSLVSQLIAEPVMRSPAQVLQETYQRLSRLLGTEENDSADMRLKLAIVAINPRTFQMQYAGVEMPIYVLTEGQLKVLAAEKLPFASLEFVSKVTFSDQQVDLRKNDRVLLFSDGYTNQFGGAANLRLMRRRLRVYIEETARLPLKEQHSTLLRRFHDWKAAHPQVDDVLMLGVQV